MTREEVSRVATFRNSKFVVYLGEILLGCVRRSRRGPRRRGHGGADEGTEEQMRVRRSGGGRGGADSKNCGIAVFKFSKPPQNWRIDRHNCAAILPGNPVSLHLFGPNPHESLKRNSALLFGLEWLRDEGLLSVVRGGYRRLVLET
ncbi:hypothetical protein Sjap_012538 [Stephania japonica]|uniref:Uncharacterized protein n=1 Tax=Stephania japonica TaxID=461633 RepID=A0AAP0P0G0_9MAGN